MRDQYRGAVAVVRAPQAGELVAVADECGLCGCEECFVWAVVVSEHDDCTDVLGCLRGECSRGGAQCVNS